jgi:hypothetical protein
VSESSHRGTGSHGDADIGIQPVVVQALVVCRAVQGQYICDTLEGKGTVPSFWLDSVKTQPLVEVYSPSGEMSKRVGEGSLCR